MRYEKPFVIEIGGAIETVQDSTAKIHILIDVQGWVTISAYQADEK
jgi:hypothetical protein